MRHLLVKVNELAAALTFKVQMTVTALSSDVLIGAVSCPAIGYSRQPALSDKLGHKSINCAFALAVIGYSAADLLERGQTRPARQKCRAFRRRA